MRRPLESQGAKKCPVCRKKGKKGKEVLFKKNRVFAPFISLAHLKKEYTGQPRARAANFVLPGERPLKRGEGR